MSVWNLSTCPICGRPHDDGTYIKIRKYIYFVCLDCSESMTDVEIKNRIIERFRKNEEESNMVRVLL